MFEVHNIYRKFWLLNIWSAFVTLTQKKREKKSQTNTKTNYLWLVGFYDIKPYVNIFIPPFWLIVRVQICVSFFFFRIASVSSAENQVFVNFINSNIPPFSSSQMRNLDIYRHFVLLTFLLFVIPRILVSFEPSLRKH